MEGRTKKSFFNIASNFIIMMTKTILNFITRTIFIKVLGETALGLNGLFSNILSMLSLAELGIGTAINFSLYKPLAEKNENKISTLMSFYKRVYKIIGIIELILGIILIPFLGVFIKNIETIENVYIIYILYLVNTASTYFISYKETLINADQRGFELTKINVVGLICLNIFQIIFLLITKNYIIYLIVQFVIQLVQRIIINKYISKKYNNINFNSDKKLDESDKKEITKNVKAMLFHKIGDYCINGTDNLIISSFINISTVGIYSNYLMITNILNGFISNAFNSITSSLGNLIVTESDEKKEKVFNIINFMAFLLYGCCAVCLINTLPSFIKLWIGDKYCLDFIITLVIVANFYLSGMRVPVHSLKSAAGLYDVDKFTPMIQSAINLIVSIILVKYIGLLGVILGTLISSLVLPCWQRPYLVYKHVIHKSSKKYFVEYFKYIIIIILSTYLSNLVIGLFPIKNLLIKFLYNGIISASTFIFISIILFRKKNEFKYIEELIKKEKKEHARIS